MTMTDLRERFRAADQIPAPDLWPSVQNRLAEAPGDERSPVRLVRRTGPPPAWRTGVRKALTVAAALALATASIAFAVRALWSTATGPAAQQKPTLYDKVHGWIACDDRGVIAVDPSDPSRRIRLTANPGDVPVAWSNDGSRLLVARYSPGVASLYVVRPDGTEVRLISGAVGANGGAFTPDGSQIVYSLLDRDTHTSSLYVVSADGGPPRQLRAGNANASYGSPAISPDGSRIAYWDAGHAGLWLINSDGTGRRAFLTDIPGDLLGGPVWSPDGTRLAVGVYMASHHGHAIYVVNADGSGLHKVRSRADLGSWSPDGSGIAFTDYSSGHLSTVNTDGTDVQELGGPSCAGAAWNPVP
jgi:hypothetical protein